MNEAVNPAALSDAELCVRQLTELGVKQDALSNLSFKKLRDKLYSLTTLRPAGPVSAEYEACESELLTRELKRRGVVSLESLTFHGPFALYQGDITQIKTDAIVNAANSAMLGCFMPGHRCIDNCIHAAAGVRLRWACAQVMQHLGRPARTAEVICTPGFNLPVKYVLHVTGPIVMSGRPSAADKEALAQCYHHLINKALEMNLHSLVCCCISTGVFAFPKEQAARIAVTACTARLSELLTHKLKVIFCVFDGESAGLYRALLNKTETVK